MGKLIDLTGKKFSKLTVIDRAEDLITPKGDHVVMWLCKCDCGNTCIKPSAGLRRGESKNCGCSRDEFDLSGEYGIGYDHNGREFYFDKEDYNLIKNYSWTVMNEDDDVKSDKIYMHRLIMGVSDRKEIVDHKNHIRYDNRKENLRIANKSQNGMNGEKRINNSSGITGVYWDKSRNKWQASITVDYKTIHLGRYNDFNDAVNARKTAEEKYFGEWSYDNSIK